MTTLGKFVDRQKLEAHFSPAITGKDAYTAGEVLLSIQKFPSADVVPVVHAHWTYEIDDLFPVDSMMICSNCGEYEHLGVNDNYCGNCGAKMDEVKT